MHRNCSFFKERKKKELKKKKKKKKKKTKKNKKKKKKKKKMLNLFGYVRTDPRSVHVFSGEPRPYFTPGGLDLLNTNPAL
jgi:recombinational DNA repair ATPase RecF